MHIRIYYQKLGGHIHCRVFTGKAKNSTHAKCGTLTFDEQEWSVVHDMLSSIAEVVPESSSE